MVRDGHGKLVIQDPRGLQGSQLSQDDGTRRLAGIFLRWKQSSTRDGDDGKVNLIIFSPSSSLQRNLEALVPRQDWGQVVRDPFCLLIVVLDDLVRHVDAAIWRVRGAFRGVERVSLACFKMRTTSSCMQAVLESADTNVGASSLNIVAIHNIAKHIIHLKESSNAAYLTANQISDQHRQIMAQPEQAHEAKVMQGVQELLQHKLTLLESCRVRVESMDSRAQNMINLVSGYYPCVGGLDSAKRRHSTPSTNKTAGS